MARDTVARSRPSLVTAGGRAFLITGLIGRLPASTLQLGLLMFVTGSGLGFTLGGLTVAAVGLGSALGAPIVGRLVDRHGPAPVVGAALLVQVFGLLGILTIVTASPQPALVLGFAAIIGAANPQIGPIARGRWSVLSREQNSPDLVRVAMGYEGACDETGFVVGPALAGLLVGLLGPVPALWLLLGFTVLGEGVFLGYLVKHSAQWRRAQADATALAGVESLDLKALLWPLAACLGVGTIFGATQTALTAVNDLRGTPALTGLVYGCVGVGSALASVLVVRLVRVPLATRIATGGLGAALFVTLLMFLDHPLPSAAAAVGVGVGVGAVLVSSFASIERSAPSVRINQAMTFAATCLTLGVSVGAASSGLLVATPAHGFWPAILAGTVALVAGLFMGRHPEPELRSLAATQPDRVAIDR